MVLSAPPEGFTIPDFSAPLDVDAYLSRLPAGATFKGTVAAATLNTLRTANVAPPTTKVYTEFRDYPMHELLELNIASARALCPDLPVREGLRRIGRALFPTFAQTLIGRVMYGVFGGNVSAIFRLANKSFEITQNTGKVRTEVLGKDTVLLAFTNTYTFLSSYHYGVLEGALERCGVRGEVWFREASPSEGEFFVAWSP